MCKDDRNVCLKIEKLHETGVKNATKRSCKLCKFFKVFCEFMTRQRTILNVQVKERVSYKVCVCLMPKCF